MNFNINQASRLNPYSQIMFSANNCATMPEKIKPITSETQTPNTANRIYDTNYSYNESVIRKSFEEKSKLKRNSIIINRRIESLISEAQSQIEAIFSDTKSKNNITARVKSEDSIYKKLLRKFKDNELKSTEINDCLNAIADAYGTRMTIKNLTPEESDKIIATTLKEENSSLTKEDILNYLNGTPSEYNDKNQLFEITQKVINKLKTAQTQEVVDTLIKAILKKEINITELNNYGDIISSYFTEEQVHLISKAYKSVTNEALNVVTSTKDGNGRKVSEGSYSEPIIGEYMINNEEKAIKPSGYATCQMNVVHEFSDKTSGLGEFQIRGSMLDEFANAEHIPYDIRKGKITKDDKKYTEIYQTIKGMNEESYNAYNSYLAAIYKWLRLQELGIKTDKPILKTFMQNTNCDIPDNIMQKLTMEGLIKTKQ